MGTFIHKGLSAIKNASLTLAVLIGVTLLLPATPAQADGKYRWQNVWSGNYLETYYSSTENLAKVIVWPYNGSSANQVWWDFVRSDGSYAILNENSRKVLDRWDQQGSSSFCWAMQYDYTGQSWQHWGIHELWSPYHGRHFVSWQNMYGCNGNRYENVLAAYEFDAMTRPGAYCDEGSVLIPEECYWRRNGQ